MKVTKAVTYSITDLDYDNMALLFNALKGQLRYYDVMNPGMKTDSHREDAQSITLMIIAMRKAMHGK